MRAVLAALLASFLLFGAAAADQRPVNIGASPNDKTGDTPRVAFGKLNANDAELYGLMATKAPIASPTFTGTATFASGAAQYPTALTVQPSTHAASRRAGLAIDKWAWVQDTNGNGTKNFALYSEDGNANPLVFGADGAAIFAKTVTVSGNDASAMRSYVVNTAVGAGVQARFDRATGTGNSYCIDSLNDGNGAPNWTFSCGPAVSRAFWQIPVTADDFTVTPGAPASSTAACGQGRIRTDASYVYVCTATNTWKRAALSAW